MSNTDDRSDKNSYYYANGERVPLFPEPKTYAVKFERGNREPTTRLSRRLSNFVKRHSREIEFIPNYGLRIYQSDARGERGESPEETTNRLVRELNEEAPVEYASTAFRRFPDEADDELMYTTNQFTVKFKPDISESEIHEMNAEHDVSIVKPLGYADNGYLLEAPNGVGDQSAVALANTYYESGRVEWANPDLVRKRTIPEAVGSWKSRHGSSGDGASEVTRSSQTETETPDASTDPSESRPTERLRDQTCVYDIAEALGIECSEVIDKLAAEGVYVKNALSHVDSDARRRVTQPERPERATERDEPEFLDKQWHLETANVPDAWSMTEGSSDITIAILDDGIDVDHPEFRDKVGFQYDFNNGVTDARPKSSKDNHGTAVAGVATAAGMKASGVAPGCSLMAIRYPEYLGVTEEAEMFQRACDEGADVINCSWGPPAGSYTLSDNIRSAIHYCLTDGRDGKGIPICWAAGNEQESVDKDGYASNDDVIAVAASNSQGTKAWYSDYGDAIWISAPSSGQHKDIFTVDRKGDPGYNDGMGSTGDAAGNYTGTFGGTSAAAPLVAGVTGLMLSANPALSQQDVKRILRETAVKIGGNVYDDTGHSGEFGYGRVAARAAVEAALEEDTGTAGEPSISVQGATTIDRDADPPTFDIELGSNNYYVVEVTTRAEQFNEPSHGDERRKETFYPYWDGGESMDYQTDNQYQLPQSVWDRLEESDYLYYRMHSAETTGRDWPGYHVTTPDSEANSAPSIRLESDDSDIGPPRSPAIEVVGSLTKDRNGEPPMFDIELGSNNYYVVEVTTRAKQFNDQRHGDERRKETFYPYWDGGESMDYRTDDRYQLPQAVWDRIEESDRLYYRMHSAETTGSDWPGYHVTTPDSEANSAPSMELIGHPP